jgi:hypothetical protein
MRYHATCDTRSDEMIPSRHSNPNITDTDPEASHGAAMHACPVSWQTRELCPTRQDPRVTARSHGVVCYSCLTAPNRIPKPTRTRAVPARIHVLVPRCNRGMSVVALTSPLPSPSISTTTIIVFFLSRLRRIASHTSDRGGIPIRPVERPPINGLGPDLLPSRYSLATAFRPPPLPHPMQQPRSPAAASAMAPGVEPAVALDQVPRWSDPDQRLFPAADEASSAEGGSEPPPYLSFSDPLTGDAAGGGGGASRFPVDQEINSRIYIWRGHPWNLEVDAVVNSTNEVGRGSFPLSSLSHRCRGIRYNCGADC